MAGQSRCQFSTWTYQSIDYMICAQGPVQLAAIVLSLASTLTTAWKFYVRCSALGKQDWRGHGQIGRHAEAYKASSILHESPKHVMCLTHTSMTSDPIIYFLFHQDYVIAKFLIQMSYCIFFLVWNRTVTFCNTSITTYKQSSTAYNLHCDTVFR